MAGFAQSMCQRLDSWVAFRFPILLASVLLAKGRRTASKWLNGSGVTDDWDRCYDLLPTVGKRTRAFVTTLLAHALPQLVPQKDASHVSAGIVAGRVTRRKFTAVLRESRKSWLLDNNCTFRSDATTT